METKTTDFLKHSAVQGDTRHRPLCTLSFPPTSLLRFLEAGPIQQGEEGISKFMEIPTGACFSTFQPNWKSVEQSSNGPGPDLTGNSNYAKSVLASTSSSDVSRQTDFDFTSRGSFNEPRDGKGSINRKKKIKISGLDSFKDKKLNLETTMLIVLTSSTRAHEICSLNIDLFVKLPTHYTFHFSKNCKSR